MHERERMGESERERVRGKKGKGFGVLICPSLSRLHSFESVDGQEMGLNGVLGG